MDGKTTSETIRHRWRFGVVLAASFFAFALYGILRAILAKQASGDAIFGAMCGYLLLGIIWRT
jgi:hypothetical protein